MNRWNRCWVLCLAVAAWPALGAENFDGTYTGKRVLTKGSDPTCPKEDPVSVIIRGETLTFNASALHDFTTGFDPRQDGAFGQIDTGTGGSTVSIQGRIVAGVMDVDVSTRTCEYHWHLTRG
jgi:hypothetical protein